MSREYDLEVLIVALERARAAAVTARMDVHFVSDIEHLISTARFNSPTAGRAAIAETAEATVINGVHADQ